MERAKKPQRLLTVLTVRGVNEVLGKLEGTIGLMVRLLYGTRMQLMECVRLRVKDVDLEQLLPGPKLALVESLDAIA
jgi:integrase